MKTIQDALKYLNNIFWEGELDQENTKRMLIDYVYNSIIEAHPDTEISPIESEMIGFPDFEKYLTEIVEFLVQWELEQIVDDMIISSSVK